MAEVVSLIGFIDKQMNELSKLHDYIFTYSAVKVDGMILSDRIISKYEMKFKKRYEDFNIMEKHETEKAFKLGMEPIYKMHNVIAV